ncbi:hypothetical protein, partial [Snodgrassella sp. CFCC 13594]|uniref:hypothetical protein n=1 Tax=Snodgrassella sp. CFCC 13594 TaxID=1775559 RepID=UPI000AF9BFA0
MKAALTDAASDMNNARNNTSGNPTAVNSAERTRSLGEYDQKQLLEQQKKLLEDKKKADANLAKVQAASAALQNTAGSKMDKAATTMQSAANGLNDKYSKLPSNFGSMSMSEQDKWLASNNMTMDSWEKRQASDRQSM